jgi:hypothetical protein
MIKVMINWLLNVNMLKSYQKCSCKLFKKNCHIIQCFKCFKFNHMTKFCKNEERCLKCADKHHFKECIVSANKKCCVNCNENHESWRCACLKWKQQIKQLKEIFQNKSVKYSEASKYNCTFFVSFSVLFLNFSSLMNVSITTSSWDISESTWQIIKVKKRWVKHSLNVISNSEKILSEQIQKH